MLSAIAVSLVAARAQVTVEVVMQQEQYLRGESLPVAVRITNRSGQTLRLGQGTDWLTFLIESREGGPLVSTRALPVEGEFTLESSKVATKRVDLAPYFPQIEPGRYTVVATVKIKDWGQERASPPKKFDITEGAKLWEQEFGVPLTPGAVNRLPDVRKYALHQASYIRGQLRLYLRVTDQTGRIVRVVRIGKMLSFSRPEPQVDQFSKLHLIYQDRPHSFSYMVFDPDGEMLVRQTYDYVNTRPRLQLNQDGRVVVTGGDRRVTRADIPPPPKEVLVPAGTNSPPSEIEGPDDDE